MQKLTLIHFRAGDKEFRLLTHFYNFIHFTDPVITNYYKRFVRDFLRYKDPIYCAAVSIYVRVHSKATGGLISILFVALILLGENRQGTTARGERPRILSRR